ncbi:hypothetical protein N836_05930 [Leptolyngbya sp. Heron Island J]|uniref:hypothetical protein n=1 Tax=Leptolyngbya sp. Heron Island J TaxID=1385935 RepID=UPI0003B96D9D|nr:hypothetical protein [Leptolyngbya sp. Heron Island J]ESA36775.1 hypothetical protein N836_05930 [Leptolyngbya sp. Heron Island J]
MSSLDNRFGIESSYSNYQVALAKSSNSIGISEIINSLNKNGTITIIPSESNILERTSYLVAYTLKSYKALRDLVWGLNQGNKLIVRSEGNTLETSDFQDIVLVQID